MYLSQPRASAGPAALAKRMAVTAWAHQKFSRTALRLWKSALPLRVRFGLDARARDCYNILKLPGV